MVDKRQDVWSNGYKEGMHKAIVFLREGGYHEAADWLREMGK